MRAYFGKPPIELGKRNTDLLVVGARIFTASSERPWASALAVGDAVSQGGEFAFVLFGAAAGFGVLSGPIAERLVLAVTLSLVISPLVFALHDRLLASWRERSAPPEFDAIDDPGKPVINLEKEFTRRRVVNTGIDEMWMAGATLGAGLAGSGALLLPFMTGYPGLCLAFGPGVSGVWINNPCLSSRISPPAGPGEGGVVKAAVEAELTRLLASGGLGEALQSGSALYNVKTDGIQLANSESPARLGAQIAGAVYGGIGK